MLHNQQNAPPASSRGRLYLLEKILTGALLIVGIGIAAYAVLFAVMYFL